MIFRFYVALIILMVIDSCKSHDKDANQDSYGYVIKDGDTLLKLHPLPYSRDSMKKEMDNEKEFIYGQDSLNRFVNSIKSPAPTWVPIDCCVTMSIYLQFDDSGKYVGQIHHLYGQDSLDFFKKEAEDIARKIPKHFTYGKHINRKGETVLIDDLYGVYVEYCSTER